MIARLQCSLYDTSVKPIFKVSCGCELWKQTIRSF